MTGTVFLTDAPAASFNKKEKAFYFLCLLFFFAVYAPGISWLYNLCMWLIFVYSCSFNTPAQKWNILKMRPSMMVIITFFLFNCGSALLSDNLKEGISWAGIRISLFIFPLALGTVSISPQLKDRIILAFVTATGCAAILCLGYAIVRTANTGDWSLLYNDNLSDITHLQSIYFAMLINIALLGLGYLMIKKSALVNRNAWWVLVVFLPVHFLLASRIAIIFLYGFGFIFACYTMLYRKKWWQGFTLAAGLLTAASLLLLLFPKTINRFREISYTHFDYSSHAKESHYNAALTPEQWNGANIRIAVWQCAWTVIRRHPLLGTGLGDKMDELKKAYAEKGFYFGIQNNRNVHNTYLDVWMSLGIIGLLLFLAGFFIFPAAACMKTGDWFGLLLLACLFISLITESYLDRTVGNTMLAFFISFIASYKKPVLQAPAIGCP